MATGRVQQRGQVTLPKEIRDDAGIAPGDLLDFKIIGPNQVVFEVVSVKPLEYFWEHFATDEPYDDDAIRAEWHADAPIETLDD